MKQEYFPWDADRIAAVLNEPAEHTPEVILSAREEALDLARGKHRPGSLVTAAKRGIASDHYWGGVAVMAGIDTESYTATAAGIEQQRRRQAQRENPA